MLLTKSLLGKNGIQPMKLMINCFRNHNQSMITNTINNSFLRIDGNNRYYSNNLFPNNSKSVKENNPDDGDDTIKNNSSETIPKDGKSTTATTSEQQDVTNKSILDRLQESLPNIEKLQESIPNSIPKIDSISKIFAEEQVKEIPPEKVKTRKRRSSTNNEEPNSTGTKWKTALVVSLIIFSIGLLLYYFPEQVPRLLLGFLKGAMQVGAAMAKILFSMIPVK